MADGRFRRVGVGVGVEGTKGPKRKEYEMRSNHSPRYYEYGVFLDIDQ